MKEFRFYKETGDKWYVDLPEWTGDKADLEMVIGADDMLSYLAEGENVVKLTLSTTDYIGSNKLIFVREATEYNNGAFYILPELNGIELNASVWLCDVTKFVFNEFPKVIFLSKNS